MMNTEVFSTLTARNKELRSLKKTIKDKDAAIVHIMAERRKEAGKPNFPSFPYTDCALKMSNLIWRLCFVETLAKSKDILESTWDIQGLHNENLDLAKDLEKTKKELEACRKSLADAESKARSQTIKDVDTIQELQDQIGRRLDEAKAVDDTLLSKPMSPSLFCFSHPWRWFRHC